MLDYDKIPVAHMREAVRDYMEAGAPPGHFLEALLANDLLESFRRADVANQNNMFYWCRWLWNEAPPASYGSREKVVAWMRAKRGEAEDDDV